MLNRFMGVLLLLAAATVAHAAELRLENVRVVTHDESFQTPATVLVEEVNRRSGATLKLSEQADSQGAIEFRAADDVKGIGTEGFQISTVAGAAPQITITASGKRGALFAVGYLLRQLDCSQGRVALSQAINVTQSPKYGIRGHQLGYRAQANSYDGWDRATFDQYIRELTFFGTNCVENIPFQDERPTPVMPVSRKEMNRIQSEICAKYDLDYWVWIPADFELTDAVKRAEFLQEHAEFSADIPRLNGLFFPGGDPGDNHPRDVLPLLADLATVVAKAHPDARIWLSLQGFDGDKVDYVFDWLKQQQPEWLGGLVGGPSSPPLEVLRERLDPRYQLRDYPDITHIVRCQYPEENLDQVVALTAGRESINPRPVYYAEVIAKTAKYTDGFLSYSDGCQDDVNKAIWSALAWDPELKPRAILVEYACCFFGAANAEAIADGILALEQNWNGPLRHNAGVAATLEQWQTLDAANPELADNWRWQMLLTRAVYDAYQRERQTRELEIERSAYKELSSEGGRTPAQAVTAALAVLNRAVSEPTRPDLRNRLLELFDTMYESIRFQSSMAKFHAISAERGCMLEFMDFPLNNRYWLEDEFAKALKLPTAEAQWARLDELKNWENPGPGGYYDDIGNNSNSPHAVSRTNPGYGRGGSSFWWFDEGKSRLRLSWLVTGSPAALEYGELDPRGSYVLRFSGFGDLKPRGDGRELEPTLYETEQNSLKEFPVPPELLEDGKLTVTFERVYLRGVNWRYQPRLAEAWLIKTK